MFINTIDVAFTKVKVPFKFVKPLFNERKNIMTEYSPCQNCAFHNKECEYEADYIICSHKLKQENKR